MTPLAHRIVKQMTLPEKKRDWLYDPMPSVAKYLNDIHCFEVTAVMPLAMELIQQLALAPEEAPSALETLLFLPAPRTWIEFEEKSIEGGRCAFLFVDRGDGWAEVCWFAPPSSLKLGRISMTGLDHELYKVKMVSLDGKPISGTPRELDARMRFVLSSAHLLLPIINTPRIIGRRQHMPHAGLERRLTASFGKGKFPLHAWTEIVLHVAKPIEIDDGEPHEAHLTGRRALHFCRAHIRIRLGRLEYVSAHWRGDPAIGIKQSRYAVVP